MYIRLTKDIEHKENITYKEIPIEYMTLTLIEVTGILRDIIQDPGNNIIDIQIVYNIPKEVECRWN